MTTIIIPDVPINASNIKNLNEPDIVEHFISLNRAAMIDINRALQIVRTVNNELQLIDKELRRQLKTAKQRSSEQLMQAITDRRYGVETQIEDKRSAILTQAQIDKINEDAKPKQINGIAQALIESKPVPFVDEPLEANELDDDEYTKRLFGEDK